MPVNRTRRHAHEITRNCTFCGKEFTFMYRFGRPPGFCSEDCKVAAKSTRERRCRTCRKRFDLPSWDSDVPVAHAQFCSPECAQASKCLHCGDSFAATDKSKFCSEKCQAAYYPGPYVCERQGCGATVHLPLRPAALTGPERFCTQICRESWAAGKGIVRGAFDANWVNYWAGINQDYAIYSLPLTTGGKPYFLKPLEPYTADWLCERTQEALLLWKSVLQKAYVELTPEQMTAYYLTHGSVSLHPAKTSTQREGSPTMWELTPWLLEDMVEIWGGAWVEHLRQAMHNMKTKHSAEVRAATKLVKTGRMALNTLQKATTLRTPKQVMWLRKYFTAPAKEYTEFAKLVREWEAIAFMREWGPDDRATFELLQPVLDDLPNNLYDYGSADDHAALEATAIGSVHLWAVRQWMQSNRPYPKSTEIGAYQHAISKSEDMDLPTYYQRFAAFVWNTNANYLVGYDPDPFQEKRGATPEIPEGWSF